MKTILITGSKGQLGRELQRQLAEKKNVRVVPVDIDELDITDAGAVTSVIRALMPDEVINCAAFTQVDACESNVDLCYRVNATGVRNLAVATKEAGARLVQISTDYVFDGRGIKDSNGRVRPYVESDNTAPVSVYGKSKLMGEEMVRSHNPNHLIFRTAWMYGEGGNFVRTMLNLAATNDAIRVVNDQRGTPTSTRELTKLMLDLMSNPGTGLYHATCEGECTWFEFAREIFRLANLSTEVIPCTTAQRPSPAKRPAYSTLSNRQATLAGAYSMAPWQDAIAVYLAEELKRQAR